ncbi:uncharacterized protein LOC124885622 isoform X2 [Capsicum annuum]|uniref:uncharacterized protein LOC124885622 isoform X2 n=1 Tax=Capsicum annuum TaxID=4072 RepID=UPI001FB06D9F|nr:uncharacterized protein LOC124885622 isoform X2 [Capsicum annuum]
MLRPPVLRPEISFSTAPTTTSISALKFALQFLSKFGVFFFNLVILSALQTKADYPSLESALVDCLERVFKTRYGASLIPHYMVFKVKKR